MPDRLSRPVSVTVRALAYQPLASGAATSAVVVGGVRSMAMPPTVACAAFPARSVTDALAEPSAPSPATVLSAGQSPSSPERASEHVHATVTSSRYQPLAFGSVVAAPCRTGGVVSTLTPETAALAELPAASDTIALAD